MLIAKIIGTKKAGENAKVEQDSKGIVTVTWESGESASYESLESFKTWVNLNAFVSEVVYNGNSIKVYKDMTVTREYKIECGADWREQLKKTGDAGHHVTTVTVTRHHKDFDEVLINDNPLFREAVDTTK